MPVGFSALRIEANLLSYQPRNVRHAMQNVPGGRVYPVECVRGVKSDALCTFVEITLYTGHKPPNK